MHKGSCLCRAVGFEVAVELDPIDACHCSQCRKQSGHFWVSADVPRHALTISGAGALTWYQASNRVRRGFCSTCGSFLFWDPIGKDRIGVAMGAFEGPTGASITEHIFVADKGDYYEITDGLPQRPQ